MFLKTLKLSHFRNYDAISFLFNVPITVLIGNNAQGKSNFLESIYFLATASSEKAERDEELIQWGQSALHIEGETDSETRLEIAVVNEEGPGVKKRVKVNGVARRVSEYSEQLVVILFSPEDINLVTGSPSLRRSHLDEVLSQIDRTYKRSVSDYDNVITRKNKVLKRIREGMGRVDELSYWTDQQLMLGASIVAKRESFFEFVNKREQRFGQFQFVYQESVMNPERLRDYQRQEIEAATSLIGPHRDDFLFTLKDQDLARFGSRGEQRTAILDLKLTELDFIEKNIGSRPVLLLDDIFSELDEDHRAHVVVAANLQQTVIATVEFDEFLRKNFKDAKLVGVSDGKFEEFS